MASKTVARLLFNRTCAFRPRNQIKTVLSRCCSTSSSMDSRSGGVVGFDAFRARLDRQYEQIRVLPTAEKDMGWEEDGQSQHEDEGRSKAADEATQKFYDLASRYGHEVDGQRLRRFRLLAAHHQPYANKWTKMLLKYPDRLDAPAQDLMAFVDFCLVDLGVNKTATFELAGALPLALFEMPEEYRRLLVNWTGLCEQFDIPFRVVADNPDILGLDPTDWTERIEDLREFFRVKRDLALLVANNPTLLTQSGPQLKAKMDFFVRTMCVKPLDLAHSAVFDKDLVSIKKRFLFLDRCGLYIRPKMSDVGTKLSAEPHISKIAGGTDNEFVAETTQGRLSVEEFDAFVGQLLPEETEIQVDDHELAKQREEEELAGEEGYHDPSFAEDIDETYAHQHNRVGRTEIFLK